MTAQILPPILVVAGPTASGKSALALAAAEEFGGTIINADSMQVYRDLAVLTARPGPEEEARVPHRLYGVIDAAETCSVGRWRELALAEIAEAQETGRLPILAGGTGLYLHALLEGLADLPEIPAEIRAEARALHARIGGAAFRDRLAEIDPDAARRLLPGDSQRLIRAYEVAAATGRPLAAWQAGQERPMFRAAAAVVLLPPRDILYAACDARLAAMMTGGAEAEVATLLARGLDPELPVLKAVGVREIAAAVKGEFSRAEALAAAQRATRHYAKRQYTWFRHRLLASDRLHRLTVDAQYSERLLPDIFPFIRHALLTGRP